jgi:hypothetical protein
MVSELGVARGYLQLKTMTPDNVIYLSPDAGVVPLGNRQQALAGHIADCQIKVS